MPRKRRQSKHAAQPSPPSAGPIIPRRITRRAANWMTWIVVLLQGAMLLTLAVTPAEAPPRTTFFQLLWASARKPTFYPVGALLLGGPVFTLLAWQIRGRHRAVLIAAWFVFAGLTAHYFGERVMTMWHVVWWQYVE